MQNPKAGFMIEVCLGELTSEGRCSACNADFSSVKGRVGSTKAFREGYENIDWKEVGEFVRSAQKKAERAHLN